MNQPGDQPLANAGDWHDEATEGHSASIHLPLEQEEYVEQAYFFRVLGERMQLRMSTQELLVSVREEILATTKMPLAIDFMASELRHHGVLSSAMARLTHYFTPFQAFVMTEAENERGRLDFPVALDILRREAEYRGGQPSRQGAFLYQFETLCRNRLGYDRGLAAIAADPIYDDAWREWIETVRRQIGLIDFADMIYVRSLWYLRQKQHSGQDPVAEKPMLFGEKEGKIALANRRKDPLLLFSALERHVGHPSVPRPKPVDKNRDMIPLLLTRLERLEARLKLVEEEHKGGIDLEKYYGPPGGPSVEPID